MESASGRESDEAKIVRAILLVSRQLRRSASLSVVTGGGLALLAALDREGPMSAVMLARSQGLQPQSLSRLLVRLDSLGLIARKTDPADGRRQVIAITVDGQLALEEAMAARWRWLGEAMSHRLDEAERNTLRAAAGIMIKIAEPARGNDLEAA